MRIGASFLSVAAARSGTGPRLSSAISDVGAGVDCGRTASAGAIARSVWNDGCCNPSASVTGAEVAVGACRFGGRFTKTNHAPAPPPTSTNNRTIAIVFLMAGFGPMETTPWERFLPVSAAPAQTGTEQPGH